MLLQHHNAIFDPDAHAAEVRRVSVRVGDVEAAMNESAGLVKEVIAELSGHVDMGESLRLDGDALPWLQLCLSGLAWGVVDV